MDYRQLNLRSEVDQYPLPLIDEVLAKLQGATIFTKVDVRQAFHEFGCIQTRRSKPPSRHDTGRSSTRYCPSAVQRTGHLPAVYQRGALRPTGQLLHRLRGRHPDLFEEPQGTRGSCTSVLTRLREAGLQIDIKKSQFGVTATKFLGFIISTSGISVDPEKDRGYCQVACPPERQGHSSLSRLLQFLSTIRQGLRTDRLPIDSPDQEGCSMGNGEKKSRRPFEL